MLPELMVRVWDGDPDERFRHIDMNRVCYNINIIARECGVKQAEFPEVYREDQFRYDYAQIIEEMTSDCADALGLSLSTDTTWGPGRTLSYVDFERWESNCWKLYTALGGTGERIPSDKFLHTVNAVLFSGEWRGSGPYHMDLDVPMVHPSSEVTAYLSESVSVDQQAAAYNALLQTTLLGDRRVRVIAHSIKPKTNIPIKFTSRPFEMYKQITLPAASWTGDGPWTQTVDIGSTVANAVFGSDERNSTAQMEAIAAGILAVSGVNGSTVTVRAIGEKPSVDVYGTVMWSAGSVS